MSSTLIYFNDIKVYAWYSQILCRILRHTYLNLSERYSEHAWNEWAGSVWMSRLYLIHAWVLEQAKLSNTWLQMETFLFYSAFCIITPFQQLFLLNWFCENNSICTNRCKFGVVIPNKKYVLRIFKTFPLIYENFFFSLFFFLNIQYVQFFPHVF